MFHNNCIKEWYANIKVEEDLTCPLCKTINKPIKNEDLSKTQNIHPQNSTDTMLMVEHDLHLESIMT